MVFPEFAAQIQHVALLAELDIKFPTGLHDILSYIGISFVDISEYVQVPDDIPDFTNQAVFTLVSICAPMVIVILSLLFFRSAAFILSYVLMTGGIVLVSTWLAVNYLPKILPDSSFKEDIFIYFSMLVLLSGIIMFIVLSVLEHVQQRIEADRHRTKQEMIAMREAHALRSHRARNFRWYMRSSFFIALGCVFLRFTDFGSDFGLKSLYRQIIAFILFGFGAIFFLWLVLGFFKFGRRIINKLSILVNKAGLRLLLLLTSASFIPAISRAIANFICHEFVCAEGTHFNPFVNRIGYENVSPQLFCDACTPLNPRCVADPSLMTPLCPESRMLMNRRDPQTPCDDVTSYLFFGSSVIVLLNYVVFIPILYFFVIRYMTREIRKKSEIFCPVERPKKYEFMSRDEWTRRMAVVRPVASVLFEPFTYKFRFFTLVKMGYDLAVVLIINVIGVFSAWASLSLLLILHTFFLLLLLKTRPYLIRLELILTIVLAGVNIVNTLFSMILLAIDQDNLSVALTVIFLLFNTIIPGTLGVMFLYFEWQRMVGGRRILASEKAMKKQLEEQTEKTRGEKEQMEANKDWTAKAGIADDESSDEEKELARQALEHNNLVTRSIDETIKSSFMGRCYLFMGVLFAFALCLALVGLLGAPDSKFRISSNPLRQTLDRTLGGYESWQQMTESCCCISTSNPPNGYKQLERWICPKVVLERGRRTKDDDGTKLRPLCAEKLVVGSGGCSIQKNTKNRLAVVCRTDQDQQELDQFVRDNQISEFALSLLF